MLQENISPANQPQTTLDEDLKRIRDSKYDPVLEAEVCGWVGTIVGQLKPASESAATWMKSGDILCQLMNAIRPGTIKKYNANTTSKFKQMENITLFLRACREVGMLEKDLFSTIDLFESKDMNAVILSLFNLGGTIQSTIPYFTGPKIGIKQSNRNFAVVPQLQKPANPPVKVKSPLAVSSLLAPAPEVRRPSRPTSPKEVIPQPIPNPEPVMTTQVREVEKLAPAISIAQLRRLPKEDEEPLTFASVARVDPPTLTAPSIALSMGQVRNFSKEDDPPQTASRVKADKFSTPQPTVTSLKAPPTVQHNKNVISSTIEMDIKPRKRLPLNSKQIISSTRTACLAVPPPVATPPLIHPAALGSYQSYGSNLLRQVSIQQPRRRHVMPADSSDKAVESATLEWMECILNESKPPVLTVHQWLASGEILCRLANAILAVSPNPNIRITSIARSIDSPMQQKDNGRKFIDICRALGMSPSDTFTPSELLEPTSASDLRKIINCVFSLGGVLQNYEWWVHCPSAPQLGKRLRILNLVKV